MTNTADATINVTVTEGGTINTTVVDGGEIAATVTGGGRGDIGPPGTTDHLLLTNIGTNTHPQIDTHIASTSNPHSVTKTQVGLGNVDNTSDVNKPISTATQAALDAKPDSLDELSDVLISSPTDGEVVRYESGQWLNTNVEFSEIGGDPTSNSNLMDVFDTKEYKVFVTVGTADADYITDGTADDVQIQAAIDAADAAGGGIVFIKEGTYSIAAQITLPFDPHVKIQGAAWIKSATGTVKGTALVASATLTSMFSLSGNSNPSTNADLSHGFQLHDLTLDGADTTTNLIYLSNQDHFVGNNLRLRRGTNTIKTAWDSSSDPIASTIPGAIFLSNSIVSANSGIGIDLQYQTQCWITNCWFTGTSVTDWIVFKSCNKIHITNCEFNTATTALNLQDTATFPCHSITVADCTFVGGKAITDTRTHASSDRVYVSGIQTSGSNDTLVGDNNIIILSNGIILGQAVTASSLSLVTDLAIADGGTGASTASAAFTALKQDATTTATGVVELATDAETTTGTDTTRAITPSNLTSQIGSRLQAYDADLDTWATKTAPSGTVLGTSDTQTITNKAITPRVVSMADATSITPTGDTADVNTQTNTQAAGTLTANAPSGTPVDEQKLVLRIKSTNAQTWSWNAIYRGSNDVTLPTSTTGSSKTDRLGFVYNSADAKWSLVAKSLGY